MSKQGLYRGKTKAGKWVYGWYIYVEKYDRHDIYHWSQKHDYGFEIDEVIPSSVGQSTGLKDKEGVDVYEGDLITVKDWTMVFTVTFENGMFVLGNLSPPKSVYQGMQDYKINGKIEMEIIGNTTDTPELLETEQSPK